MSSMVCDCGEFSVWSDSVVDVKQAKGMSS